MALNKAQLTALLADLQARVQLFKSFDQTKEINQYCDELETQVNHSFTAAITHLRKNQQNILDEIGQYRSKLLFQDSSSSSGEPEEVMMDLVYRSDEESDDDFENYKQDAMVRKPKEAKKAEDELKTLTQKVQELSAELTGHLESKAGKRVTKKSLEAFAKDTQEYLDRCKEAQSSLKAQTFKNLLLKFNPKKLFTLSDDHVGTLEYSKEFNAKDKGEKGQFKRLGCGARVTTLTF